MYKFDSKDFFVSSLSKAEIWAIAFYNEYIDMVKASQSHKCRVKSVEGVSPGHDYYKDEPMPPLTGGFCFLHKAPLDSDDVCPGGVRELKRSLDPKTRQTLDKVLVIRDEVVVKLRSWGFPENMLDTVTRKDIKAVN